MSNISIECISFKVNTSEKILLCSRDQYEDFAKLKDEIVLLHNSEVGILISGKIHSLFHRKYGAEATKDDFIKFLKEDYNTDLCDIIRNSPIG